MAKPTPNDAAARRVAYSLAAGATTALAGSDAAGQIVWSTPQDISIAQFNEQTLNLDGDVYYDLRLKNYVFSGGNYQGAYVIYGPGKTIGTADRFAYATALQLGDSINESTTSSGFATTSLAYGANNPNAEFNNASGAFIGLSFPIGGELHYGWVRVSIDNSAGTFVIHDWAYNIEAGKGIAAGQRADFNGDGVTDAADYTVWRDTLGTTRVGDEFIAADVDLSDEVDAADYAIWAEDYGLHVLPDLPIPELSQTVPEPGTLGLLACGAAGLGFLRRRRSDSPTPAASESNAR